MNAHYKALILTFLILITSINIFLWWRIYPYEEQFYPSGKDTYTSLGNGQFQIGIIYRDGEKILTLDNENFFYNDAKVSRSLMSKIEKYLIKEPHIYLTGYYSSSVTYAKSSDATYYSYDPKTNVRMKFYSIEEIPRYTILNYRTGDAQFYKKFEDIPLKNKIFFSHAPSFQCQFWRKCYDITLD